jgi:tRNA threonylcarbamoyladenosine biosynthesis protein TsaB
VQELAVAEPWLILETSGRAGTVGVAVGGTVVVSRSLDGAKRHNRDLIPTCGEMLSEAGYSAKQLAGVMVGVGPGSYTGLRVGLTAAKGFALATGCAFVAVPTYHTLAAQALAEWQSVDVIGDALQGTIYRQRFGPTGEGGLRPPMGELEIVHFEEWKSALAPDVGVTGPGAEQFRAKLDGHPVAVTADCHPTAGAVLRVGRTLPPLTRPGWFGVEPLYLRGSSAEEKAKREGN